MRLEQVRIRKTTRFPNSIEFDTTERGVTVLYGPNGPEKTWLLELLAAAKEDIGAYGVAATSLWPKARPSLEIDLDFSLDEEERNFAGTERDSASASAYFGYAPPGDGPDRQAGLSAVLARSDDEHGRWEYIPAERSLLGAAPGGAISQMRRLLRLSRDIKKYAGLIDRLVEEGRDKTDRWKAFTREFQRLGRSIKSYGIVRGDSARAERAQLGFERGEERLLIEGLGLDEHQYVLLAGLAALSTWRGSIILFDEPELHMNETDASALVATLPEVFPGAQIIVGTRSRAVADLVEPRFAIQLGKEGAS